MILHPSPPRPRRPHPDDVFREFALNLAATLNRQAPEARRPLSRRPLP